MHKRKSNFISLSESAIERFQQGGFLNGDFVKFVKNLKSTDYFKKSPEHVKQRLEELSKTDYHLRVSAIKTIRPSTSSVDAGGNSPDDFYVDVVVEYAPGLYKDPVTVPIELIELVDSASNAMGKIGPTDGQVYKNNIHGAKEQEGSDPNRSTPKKNTKLSNSNSWANTPGGGGGDGMKKIKENKDDVSAITEAYESILKKRK